MERVACGHFSARLASDLLEALRTDSAVNDSMKLSSFGRGEATVFDESVRNSLECHPDVVQAVIDQVCPTWYSRVVEPAVKVFRAVTGLEDNCYAELHKMLTYGEGGVFDWHVDTPKTPLMVGTLVVALEAVGSAHLELRTDEGTVAVTTGAGQWAAFSASTYHRVPLLPPGAYRTVLVYNISVCAPAPFTADDGGNSSLVPGKLYILSHRYPPKQFSMMGSVAVGRDRTLYQQMCREFGEQRVRVMSVSLVEHFGNFENPFQNVGYDETEGKTDVDPEVVHSINVARTLSKSVEGMTALYSASAQVNGKTVTFREDQIDTDFTGVSIKHCLADAAQTTATGNEGVELFLQYVVTGLMVCEGSYPEESATPLEVTNPIQKLNTSNAFKFVNAIQLISSNSLQLADSTQLKERHEEDETDEDQEDNCVFPRVFVDTTALESHPLLCKLLLWASSDHTAFKTLSIDWSDIPALESLIQDIVEQSSQVFEGDALRRARHLACVALALCRYESGNSQDTTESWKAVVNACQNAGMDFPELSMLLPGGFFPTTTDNEYAIRNAYYELGLSSSKVYDTAKMVAKFSRRSRK